MASRYKIKEFLLTIYLTALNYAKVSIKRQHGNDCGSLLINSRVQPRKVRLVHWSDEDLFKQPRNYTLLS